MFDMDKMMKLMKQYWLEVIYVLILMFVFVSNQSSEQSMLLIKGALVVSLWVIPYLLNLRFKVVNTVILSASIIWITSSFFKTNRDDASILAVVIALMLFIALVLNVFSVIREMYRKKEKGHKKYNGLKLSYVILAFLIVIGTILISYSHIYKNIHYNELNAFAVANDAQFSAIYYSFTTYFTVGFGDVTPISNLARIISMTQMIFGYIITCLVIPTVLVAFQKLFDD